LFLECCLDLVFDRRLAGADRQHGGFEPVAADRSSPFELAVLGAVGVGLEPDGAAVGRGLVGRVAIAVTLAGGRAEPAAAESERVAIALGLAFLHEQSLEALAVEQVGLRACALDCFPCFETGDYFAAAVVFARSPAMRSTVSKSLLKVARSTCTP